jgi:hypothetical protein
MNMCAYCGRNTYTHNHGHIRLFYRNRHNKESIGRSLLFIQPLSLGSGSSIRQRTHIPN